MKKQTCGIFAVLLAASLVLGGCSKSSTEAVSSAAASYAPEMAVPQATPVQEDFAMDSNASMEEAGISVTAPTIPSNRKVILNSSMELETTEFDQALAQIMTLTESAGGYLESQETQGRSLQEQTDSLYTRHTSLVLRIPAQRLGEISASIGEFCNVVSQSQGQEDITDSYFDAEAHLKSLELQEERLLEILGRATKLADVISLETALSEVRYQIESLTSSIRRMDSQVAYSYLSLYLTEVRTYQAPLTTAATFGNRLSSAASRSGDNIIRSVQGLLLFLVEVLPVLLLWVAIIGGISFVVFRITRKIRGGKEARLFRKRIRPTPVESDQNDSE